jgi:glucokinase
MFKNLVGIEIGGTKLQLVIADEKAHILNQYRLHVHKELGAEGIRAQIGRFLCEWRRHHLAISGIGVGFGGPVDVASGRIICSHQIQGWDQFNLKEWILSVYGSTCVHVENDANTAALGESLCGAGKGCNPVMYVTLGSGVGGGAVVEGKIYHGAHPGEVEIGHVRLDKEGRTVESCCSGWAVDRKILSSIQEKPDTCIAQLCTAMHSKHAAALLPALNQGDEEARRILDETADDLAYGLSHAVHLLHPQAIILGGGLSLLGEPLRLAVAQKIQRYVMQAFQPGPEIRLALLGEQAVPTGALELVRNSC